MTVATVFLSKEDFEQVINVVTWEIKDGIIIFYAKENPDNDNSNQTIIAYKEYFCFLVEEER